jgi:hypothetical protein
MIDTMDKLKRYFTEGPGKKLSIDDASSQLKISYDVLVALTFHFGIKFHVAAGEIFYYKHELARWVLENPTILLRARINIKKRRKNGTECSTKSCLYSGR